MPTANVASALDAALRAAGIPIVGVTIGDPADKTTWSITFLSSATSDQQTAGALVITAFDPTAAPAVRALSPLDFAGRFTDAELVAFETLCGGTDANAAAARVAQEKLSLVQDTVGLDDADTIKYLAFMQAAGILTADRVTEIRA